MLAENIIELAQTEWAAPNVSVPKKYQTLQICVDYRKLNAIAKQDSYPIPLIYECIDSVDKPKVFSALDAISVYWQN